MGGLTIQGDQLRSHTWRRDILGGVTATVTEQEAYVAMNPYFAPRGGERRLAGINALWLDLDTYRVPSLATLPRHEVPERILSALREAELPSPSMLLDSGRGYYCIWLVSGASPAAACSISTSARTAPITWTAWPPGVSRFIPIN